MAKRRKKMSKGRKKSYRVYARKVGSVSLQEVAVALGGAIASRFAVNALGKVVPQIGATGVSKAATQIALGFVTKPLAGMLGVKSANVDALAKGMIIGGGYELVKQVAPSVLGATDGDVIVVSGMNDISEINGMDEIGNNDISEINGMDEIGMYEY